MKVSQHTEQVINKFAEMMIKRMEEMKIINGKKDGSAAITAPVRSIWKESVTEVLMPSCLHGAAWNRIMSILSSAR